MHEVVEYLAQTFRMSYSRLVSLKSKLVKVRNFKAVKIPFGFYSSPVDGTPTDQLVQQVLSSEAEIKSSWSATSHRKVQYHTCVFSGTA